ncbi:MAG: hypothetical protein ACREP6_04395 [Candidatus Binataceae bacterium]
MPLGCVVVVVLVLELFELVVTGGGGKGGGGGAANGGGGGGEDAQPIAIAQLIARSRINGSRVTVFILPSCPI